MRESVVASGPFTTLEANHTCAEKREDGLSLYEAPASCHGLRGQSLRGPRGSHAATEEELLGLPRE